MKKNVRMDSGKVVIYSYIIFYHSVRMQKSPMDITQIESSGIS